MRVTPPEHAFCWVHNKWGRHKARALLEKIDRNGTIMVQVYFLSVAFAANSKTGYYYKKNIEYIDK